jgi:hypothetical protein
VARFAALGSNAFDARPALTAEAVAAAAAANARAANKKVAVRQTVMYAGKQTEASDWPAV